jgi:multicomponent Na+:H+ antiporter subunit D
MVAGLSMHSELALTGAIFYMIHDIVVKGNLFLVGGMIYKIKGSNSMKDLGGFYGSRRPSRATCDKTSGASHRRR